MILIILILTLMSPIAYSPMNEPQPSRPSPPIVTPIIYNGVRYEQDMESYTYGGTQPGGYLVAIDLKTNERLWMLKVYEVKTHEGVGSIGRYFKSMKIVWGELEIEAEYGGKYIVNLVKRDVRKISQ